MAELTTGGQVDVRPMSGGPAARLALLRRVADLDLAGSIKVDGIAGNDPLLSWVQGPRALGDLQPYDSLWVRLVDLPEALATRGYEADCDVVVEVDDERRAVERRPLADPGQGRHRRGDARPTTRRSSSLPSPRWARRTWAAPTWPRWRAPGSVAEHRPGAARDLWRAFRTDVGPYAARGF